MSQFTIVFVYIYIYVIELIKALLISLVKSFNFFHYGHQPCFCYNVTYTVQMFVRCHKCYDLLFSPSLLSFRAYICIYIYSYYLLRVLFANFLFLHCDIYTYIYPQDSQSYSVNKVCQGL